VCNSRFLEELKISKVLCFATSTNFKHFWPWLRSWPGPQSWPSQTRPYLQPWTWTCPWAGTWPWPRTWLAKPQCQFCRMSRKPVLYISAPVLTLCISRYSRFSRCSWFSRFSWFFQIFLTFLDILDIQYILDILRYLSILSNGSCSVYFYLVNFTSLPLYGLIKEEAKNLWSTNDVSSL